MMKMRKLFEAKEHVNLSTILVILKTVTESLHPRRHQHQFNIGHLQDPHYTTMQPTSSRAILLCPTSTTTPSSAIILFSASTTHLSSAITILSTSTTLPFKAPLIAYTSAVIPVSLQLFISELHRSVCTPSTSRDVL
ncbi:hypothetical protein UPYG_G00079570 [Umbra pygmaea]|uniref:Uncharacterized protein n=1 Tax=Umbra pygmaea TaxID=75934 RepID=A0ABD0Y0U8_UMBPY